VFEAADALLVPIIPATLSSRTFDQLAELVASAKDGGPQVLAFFSMVEVRKSLHREVMARVRAAHPGLMLGAAIPAADEIERMGEARQVVDLLAPRSRAAISYAALWWDLRRRLSQYPPPEPR
jgi:cellulose biosynthesis protein BcsQ